MNTKQNTTVDELMELITVEEKLVKCADDCIGSNILRTKHPQMMNEIGMKGGETFRRCGDGYKALFMISENADTLVMVVGATDTQMIEANKSIYEQIKKNFDK